MNLFARIVVWVLALLVAVLPVVAVLNGWFAADRWPIEHLRVTAEYRRVSAEQVQQAVAPHLQRGFFAVDLQAAHAAVAALDWVESVEVRKHWPNRVDLTVREHQPFARWGEDKLISTQGRVFAMPASGAPAGLPEFEGSEQRLADILDMYRDVSALLASHGSQLVAVRLSPRGSWTFRLAGDITVMAGRGDPQPRVARFAPLLAALVATEARPLLRADLRYANGFALRWGEPAGTDESPAPGRAPATTAAGMDT